VKRPLAPPYAPETRQKGPGVLGCRRDCCWSPYGHSTARGSACHCHDEPKPDPLTRLLANMATLGPQECETPECARFIGHDGDHYPTKENHDG
jgi:hypothetical protein